jgi:uncharacterized membrane protein YbaN (DUF454 family)
MVKKYLLIFAGLVSFGFGVAGMFLPVLPTTPFLLLSAACFLRSSDRLYHWLTTHRLFGRYITNYIKYKAITRRTKIFTIALLWITITLSVISIDKTLIRLVLLFVALGVTTHLLLLKTMPVDDIADDHD